MKYVKLFFIEVIFVACSILGDIDVKSAEYEQTCNHLGEQISFQLNFDADEGDELSSKTFTIKMRPLSGEDSESQCSGSQDHPYFTCIFNPTNEGIYYPLLEEYIMLDEVIVNEFNLTDYPVSFTNKEYIQPAEKFYNRTVYVYRALNLELKFEFTDTLTDGNLPVLTLNGKDNICHVDLKDNKILSCTIYATEYPISEEPYYGNFTNVCGFLESSIEVHVLKKEDTGYVIVNGINATSPGFKCNETLPSGSEIYLSYYFFMHTLESGSTITINNLIKLVNTEDSESIIDTKCTLGNLQFICITQNDLPKEGSYQAILSEDFNYTRERGDFIFRNFSTNETINFNQNFVQSIIEGSQIKVSKDYKDGNSGEIVISYLNEIPTTYPLIIEGNDLNCTRSSNEQHCTYSASVFPPLTRATPFQYKGYLETACGNKDADVILEVRNSTPIFINFTNPAFPSPIEPSEKTYAFPLQFVASETITDVFTLEELKLKNEETTIPLICEHSEGDNFVLCTAEEPKPGKYKVVLETDITKEPYIFGIYTSFEEIVFIKDYTEPKNKENKFTYDYIFGNEGSFIIEFNSELGEYNPIVKLHEKELTCEKSGANLNCKFQKEDFPVEEPGPIFNGNVITPIGTSDATIILTVKESQKVEITLNAEIPKIAASEEKIEFKVEFKGEVDTQLELNGLTLFNEVKVIELKCENKLGHKYFDCSADTAEEGKFKVKLEKDEEHIIYVIKSYTSEEEITFVKDYTLPKNSEISMEHDYAKDGSTGILLIEFQKDLGEYKPKVVFNTNEFKCESIDSNLNCTFTEKELPPKSKDTIYEGHVVNPVNSFDANINITIIKKNVGNYLSFCKVILLLGLLLIL